MTDYFVSQGGNNSDGLTWAKAYTSLASALTAASTDGDRVIIQYDNVPDGDEELAADTTYTAAASIEIITSTNSGTSTVTPTVMGVPSSNNWIGNSTTNRGITITPATNKLLYLYGLTLRISGTSADLITLNSTGHVIADNCYFWQGCSSNTGHIALSGGSTGAEYHTTVKNSTFRFGATGQRLLTGGGNVVLENCTVSADGSAITGLFLGNTVNGGPVIVDGCDVSHVNATLVGNQTTGSRYVVFRNCKLPASYVAMDSQTAPGKAGAEVFLYDCYSGDEHVHIGHYNGLGETTISLGPSGIYCNDNIADSNLSWKIVGTTQATAEIPYESPWIEVYHTGTSAITPYLEICRSGSNTAYNNNEVWAQFAYKGTSGSTKVTFAGDGMALAGSAAAQANSSKGASDWSNENATSWFGKIDSGSSITPAEVGHIRARVCVAGANTVYVDPQIRGLS